MLPLNDMARHVRRTARHVTNKAKESFSVKGVIATAILTMITTGTVQFLADTALAREQTYWEKYKQGQDAKDRWWDAYFKSITKNCGN